ncbi:Ca-activated chloride channel family protein [Allochromatium warmingii]|uniref:Ca-activated chloride channel family protein n=2 Tax=Allochromatium warmingii TaxID=61595 RepID=A0A1H3H1T0_ALLWA|nr:Ca-activated chloride channel family protein [Allochromatium warmingii]
MHNLTTSPMFFLRPLWFLALIPLAWLLWRLWRQRTQAASWAALVDPQLLPHLLVGHSTGAPRWPLALLGIGWLIGVIALAGPVWRQLPQPVLSLDARSVIVLDLSPSFDAADVSPTRLARARFETLDLLRALHEGQIGLLAFGPEPFLVAPLSADANTIAAQVPLLTTDLIPLPGPRRTDLALEQAAGMLERAGSGAGHVVLITDGVGELAGSLAAARALATAGHRLSVLAVGTLDGAPVPRAGGGFEQDAAGAVQIARLERERLRDLADAGNGRYLEASVGEADTQALLAAAPRPEVELAASNLTADRWREEGPWLLLLVLPLAALAFRRGWLAPAVALALCVPPDSAQALDWADLWWTADQRAAQELAAGHPETAATQFDDPAWRAAAHYRAGEFEQALTALDGRTDATATYNRGNALARLGRFDAAAAAYEQVLQQAPDHADARHNLELVRRLRDQEQDQDQKQRDDGQNGSSQSPSESSAGSQTNADAQSQPHPDITPNEQAKPQPDAESDQPAASERAAKPESESESESKPETAASESVDDRSPAEREREQALEARLRQVPDDPAGLLRQRFLLQHLRREGQLP